MFQAVRRFGGTLSLLLLLASVPAHAQWVMVARAVAGRVEQMTNKPSGGPGYDVATVVLEAPAEKVYSTALGALKTHAGITVTKSDDKKHLIDFTNGVQVASMKATPLGDKLTQLVIASTLTSDSPSAASLVVQGVMHVCKDMNVECTVAGN